MAQIYSTQPKLHRTGITAVDAADPADASSGVHTAGYEQCRFDITLTGTGIVSLEVQTLFWNPRQSVWVGGGKRVFNAPGKYALAVECRGAAVFLKVTGFNGTSFSLAADYVLS
jgi:hypothetical protein